MDHGFDPEKFIRRIGERLVEEFRDAKSGTTPSTVGSAAEQPVRDQLEQVLPWGIAVGEGFVIDSYGATSRQQDVILYERDICPVFSINRTPQTTYYPCEGVIGTGEIKSSLDRGSLQDAFEKIASMKRLQRHRVHHLVPHPETGAPIPMNRNYLTSHTDSVIDLNEKSDQEEKLQIFGFVLAGESRLKHETLVETFRALASQVGESLSPNVIATLDGHVVSWGSVAKQERKEVSQGKDGTYGVTVYKDGPEAWKPSWSSESATHVGGSESADAFRILVRGIRGWAEVGRTSGVKSFDCYFEVKSNRKSHTRCCLPRLGTSRKGET